MKLFVRRERSYRNNWAVENEEGEVVARTFNDKNGVLAHMISFTSNLFDSFKEIVSNENYLTEPPGDETLPP